MSSSASWAESPRSLVCCKLPSPGIPDFNLRVHCRHWAWFLSTSYRVPWIFDRRCIASVSIYGIHQLSIPIVSRKAASIWSLARCGSITLILALIMFASANFTLIYCLAVQIALISFYRAEIDDRLFTGLLHLNLGYPSCAIGTSFTTNRSIGRWS